MSSARTWRTTTPVTNGWTCYSNSALQEFEAARYRCCRAGAGEPYMAVRLACASGSAATAARGCGGRVRSGCQAQACEDIERRLGMRYWARYADRISWEAGEPATTVVRQHDETARAESFRSWGGWAPTQALDDLADARPSSPAHLVEIDAEEAD